MKKQVNIKLDQKKVLQPLDKFIASNSHYYKSRAQFVEQAVIEKLKREANKNEKPNLSRSRSRYE